MSEALHLRPRRARREDRFFADPSGPAGWRVSPAAPPGSRRPRRAPGFRGELLLNRLLWLVVAALGLFLLAQLTFHFAISPRLRIRNVEIRCDLPLSRQEVLELAGMTGKEHFFSLDPQEIRRRLEAQPVFRKVTVEKVFPDTLRIRLTGRSPLLVGLGEAQERSVPALIDEEGMVYETEPALMEGDLPVVSGLKFQGLEEGVELPRLLAPLLRELAELKEKQPDLYRLISEVRIVPINPVQYELLIYPLFGTTRIRTAGTLRAETLQNAFLVLDLLRRQGVAAKVQEIDFRTREVVYRAREEEAVGGE